MSPVVDLSANDTCKHLAPHRCVEAPVGKPSSANGRSDGFTPGFPVFCSSLLMIDIFLKEP